MLEVKNLISEGNTLFSKRGSLATLWQEIADHFYVERADFTRERYLGTDFASHLTTSFPLLVRRDLANSVSAMLRPPNKNWFNISTEDTRILSIPVKQWLETATLRQRGFMYARNSQFIRATKEGDSDFVTFGQTVLSVTKNKNLNGLLYKCHHLRDVCWSENDDGMIDSIYVKIKIRLCDLVAKFGLDKVSPNLRQKYADSKFHYDYINIYHIVVPTEKFNSSTMEKKIRQPYVSVYAEIEDNHALEIKGSKNKIYCIPRWATVSGSQYAHSPATVCALPEGRLLQQMNLTILEAGEKAVNPPMVAVQNAIRSDISIYAGGVTWTDAEYDERTGEVLRPITQDRSGLPFGLEMIQDSRQMLNNAFFINQLSIPGTNQSGTAYETSQLVQEYIRKALPLFEPMEQEYNGELCSMTFELLLDSGAFGAMDEIPKELSSAEIKFKFESPITDAIGKDKGQKYLETKALLLEAAQLDKAAIYQINSVSAIKDVLDGIQVPAGWRNSDEEIAEMIEAEQMQAAATQVMQNLEEGGKAAEQLGKAQQALGEGAQYSNEAIF